MHLCQAWKHNGAVQAGSACRDPETPVPADRGLIFCIHQDVRQQHEGDGHFPGVGASTRKKTTTDRGRSLPTDTCFRLLHFITVRVWYPKTRAGTWRRPPSPAGVLPRHRSSPSARNSQLQEDTLPGRQAPCAQDASSMSSPLSLGGERRADRHTPAATLQRHARVAPPPAGTRRGLPTKQQSCCDPGACPNAPRFLPQGQKRPQHREAERLAKQHGFLRGKQAGWGD